MTRLDEGVRVQVRNLDDEVADGRVDAVLEETVGERSAPFMSVDGASLLDYWRGTDVTTDDRVVRVDLGTGVYDYPESRVEVLEE